MNEKLIHIPLLFTVVQILCGYHHQIHHPGHRARCAFGIVHDVRYLTLSRDYRCSRCTRQFRSQHSFVDHWYLPGSSCPSPFMLTPPSGAGTWQVPPAHVIEIQCGTCRSRIDRVTPAFADEHYKLPRNRKRRRSSFTGEVPVKDGPCEQFTGWVDSWSRLCVNHAYLHMNDARSGDLSCSLSIRFVLVNKAQVFAVPPFANQSDEALLDLCLCECKRLYKYLEQYRTGRKALLRETKTALNELREMVRLESSFVKINTPRPKQQEISDSAQSSSGHSVSCAPFFIL